MLLYQFHENTRAWMAPITYWSEAVAKMYTASGSWLSGMPGAQRIAAGYELIHIGVEGMRREQVAQSALQQCNDRGAGQCRVLFASCSMECDPSQMGCELPRPQKN